jgi:hypothetical protein
MMSAKKHFGQIYSDLVRFTQIYSDEPGWRTGGGVGGGERGAGSKEHGAKSMGQSVRRLTKWHGNGGGEKKLP